MQMILHCIVPGTVLTVNEDLDGVARWNGIKLNVAKTGKRRMWL